MVYFAPSENEIAKLTNLELVNRLIREASDGNEFDNRETIAVVSNEVLRRLNTKTSHR